MPGASISFPHASLEESYTSFHFFFSLLKAPCTHPTCDHNEPWLQKGKTGWQVAVVSMSEIVQTQNLFGPTLNFFKVYLPTVLCFGVSFITGWEMKNIELYFRNRFENKDHSVPTATVMRVCGTVEKRHDISQLLLSHRLQKASDVSNKPGEQGRRVYCGFTSQQLLLILISPGMAAISHVRL